MNEGVDFVATLRKHVSYYAFNDRRRNYPSYI